MIQDFKEHLIKSLSSLQQEVKAYPSDQAFQETRPSTSNSAEVLCQHIIGNLHHFIGAQLGGIDYQRDRDSEFQSHGYSRETIIDSLEETKDVIGKVFEKLWNEDLSAIYPIPFREQQVTVHHLLLEVTAHLDYHLGQLVYNRRID